MPHQLAARARRPLPISTAPKAMAPKKVASVKGKEKAEPVKGKEKASASVVPEALPPVVKAEPKEEPLCPPVPEAGKKLLLGKLHYLSK